MKLAVFDTHAYDRDAFTASNVGLLRTGLAPVTYVNFSRDTREISRQLGVAQSAAERDRVRVRSCRLRPRLSGTHGPGVHAEQLEVRLRARARRRGAEGMTMLRF